MRTQTKLVAKIRYTKSKKKKFEDLVLDEIDKALEVAFFYGFVPIKRPSINQKDLEATKSFDNNICSGKIDDDLERCHRLDNKVCILRSYVEGNFRSFPQPIMLSFRDRQRSVNSNNSLLNLSIIGTQNSIAEIVAIKASMAILSEQNYQDLSVEINSIGDKESFSKFEKELLDHVKKNTDSLPENIGEIKKDSKQILERYSQQEESNEFWSSAPKPINYLNPENIKHFQEILEYLEKLEIPYNLNHFLIPDKNICHQTVFQIKNNGVLVALGVRHQSVVKKLSLRKEIPFLTVALRDGMYSSKKIKTKKIKPGFFLIQFGSKAKIKSLIVIEELRKAGIPIYHLLTKDRLVGQLAIAEDLKFSYLLIIGEKEATEESVVVRNAETRAQKTVRISNLVNYLKKIRV